MRAEVLGLIDTRDASDEMERYESSLDDFGPDTEIC